MKKFISILLVCVCILSIGFMPSKDVYAAGKQTVIYKNYVYSYFGGELVRGKQPEVKWVPSSADAYGDNGEPKSDSFQVVQKKYLGESTQWYGPTAYSVYYTYEYIITERY